MSFMATKSSLEQFITENIPGLTIVYENDTLTDPTVQEWIKIHFMDGIGKQISLGDNPYFRYSGVLNIMIFVKPDTGSGRAAQIADIITPLIRSKRISGTLFQVPYPQKIGVREEWYQVNLLTNYQREEN